MARNPNRMIEAIEKLTSNFNSCASILVTYSQIGDGETRLTGIAATPFRTPYDVMDGGVIITVEIHDFVISVSNMDGLIPKSGDTITDLYGRKYIVSMPGKMNVYESFQGIAYKIHTKAVS